MKLPTKLVTAFALAGAALTFATPANAALVVIGTFSGTDCSGQGGFPNCWATQNGVLQGPVTDPLGSPAVYKWNNGDESETNTVLFPSIDGSEFTLDIEGTMLSFTYTQGDDDPFLHYFTVKQGDEYVLFYDENAITSGSVDLAVLFPNNTGWSHVTWFDTGDPGGVPEPGTWAMMLMGFGATGFALRRRRKPTLTQLA